MEQFNMAYIIQCHKNSNQVSELIKALDDTAVDFYIHVDKKSNIADEIIKKENVFIINNRYDVIWGAYTQIAATIELLKETNKKKYNYVHFISGQDFPIKSKDEIKKYFMGLKDKELIECTQLPNTWYMGGLNRVEVYYPVNLMGRNKVIGKLLSMYTEFVMKTGVFKRNIKGLPKLYGGSSWFSLTGSCVTYILHWLENNKSYYEFFKNSSCGDELFFQTIVMNSPFKDKIVNDSKRYIDWSGGKNSPKTLGEEDFQKLITSDKLFARKVDLSVNNLMYLLKNHIELSLKAEE